MFDLKKPCNNCPFRKTQGKSYQLSIARLNEIFKATAFECHKTTGVAGPKHEPQQCAGVMALLHKEDMPNQIMQVAERLTGFDANRIDGSNVYNSFKECIAGHS